MQPNGRAVFLCRPIYDQSFEDVAWHAGDNNGMPCEHQQPASDLAKEILHQHQQHSGGIVTGIREAAHMDSPDPLPPGQGNWQRGSALQTLAMGDQDLPVSPEQQVGPL